MGSLSNPQNNEFDSLLEKHNLEIQSSSDVVSLAVHNIVFNLGFNISGDTSTLLTRTPAGLVLHYNYLDTLVKMQLTIFPLGATILVIHCHLPDTADSFTLQIKQVQEYVQDMRLVNYDRLKRSFTSSIGERLRHKARLLSGVEKGLLSLPDEVLRNMLKFLDYRSVLSLCATNTKFWTLGQESDLWKCLLKKHYPNALLTENESPNERFIKETRKLNARKKLTWMSYSVDPFTQEPLYPQGVGGGTGPGMGSWFPPPFFPPSRRGGGGGLDGYPPL